MERYILTGTPGAGKTTLIHKLKARDYYVIHEAATDIITSDQSHGVPKPWMHPSFIEWVVTLQKERQISFPLSNITPQFFDRSPMCTYALCVFLGYTLPQLLIDEIERIIKDDIYERHVFFIENLGYIHTTDARKINLEDAVRFEALHRNIYEQFGFKLISIPALCVEKRTQLVIDYVNQSDY